MILMVFTVNEYKMILRTELFEFDSEMSKKCQSHKLRKTIKLFCAKKKEEKEKKN